MQELDPLRRLRNGECSKAECSQGLTDGRYDYLEVEVVSRSAKADAILWRSSELSGRLKDA